MKRYLIQMEDGGFEFQTEHFVNTKGFWEELAHDSYFRIGDGIYIPMEEKNVVSVTLIGNMEG